MPVVSAGNLTLLRSEYHRHAVRFSWLVPPTLWTARIDDVSIVKGETSIDFDTGAGSFFSMVGNLQEVWVGSTPAANDVGRLRIKSISSGDAGVTGTLTVGGHSHPLQDDLYLTFLHDYPLKPKFSYIDPSTETWYMDDDVTYSDQHTKPPPVVIAGPHRAAFLDDVSGDVLFNVDASASYTIASGATKSSYGLTVASTAGAPTVNFNTGTGLGDITFDAAGVYWARYTVTDSNGKTQESYRCYIIHDPDAQAGSYPWTFCERVQLEDDWENGGWTAGVRAKDDFALSDIPDHTLCIIWQDAEYGGTQGPITFLPDDNQAVFVGYVREDSDTQDMAAGFGEVDLVLSTIEGRLRRIFSFSTSLIADKNPNDWYEYESWITCGRIVHDLFLWRCNLLEIADVFGLTDDTLNRMFQAFDEGNIYDNANNFLYNEGIRKRVLCDQGGRVHISSEQQLLVDSDRGALTTSFELIQTAGIGDYGESLVIERKQEFQVPFVTGNGIYWDGATWDGDNRPEATGDFCSIAPGGKPLYDGPSPQDFPKQTVSSQANLNAIIGRYEAKLNNPVGEIVLRFHGAYNTVLDAAYGEEYIMDLQASENPRGISWSNKPLYLKHVQAIFEASPGPGTWEVHASFEPEHITTDGVFTECPSFPPLGGIIPPIIPPDEVPGALMTGASVNYKSASGDLWVQRVSAGVADIASDPFWRVKQGTSSPASAIVFRCGTGSIRRTTDAFAAVDVDVTPGTNPPNDAGDSPAPTVGNVTFRQMEGSYLVQDTFVFMATWQNASSVWRTWLLYTDDNGSTWTWQSVSSGVGDEVDSYDTAQVLKDDGEWPAMLDGVAMTPSKGIMGYVMWDGDLEGRVRVYNIQTGGVFVQGDEYQVTHWPDATVKEFNYVKLIRWDNTKFLAVYEVYNETWSPIGERFQVWARSGELTGDIVNWGEAKLVSINATGRATGITVKQISETKAAVCYGAFGWYVSLRIITRLGNTIISVGDERQLDGYRLDGYNDPAIHVLSDTFLAVSFVRRVLSWEPGYPVGEEYLYTVLAVIGTSTAVFQPTTVKEVSSDLVYEVRGHALDSTSYLIAFREQGSSRPIRGVVATVTGFGISLGTEQGIDNDTWGWELLRLTDDSFLLEYQSRDNWPDALLHKVGTISAGTISMGTETDTLDDHGEPSALALHGATKVVTLYQNIAVHPSGDYNIKAQVIHIEEDGLANRGLGLSLSKGAVEKAWLTLNDDNNLVLVAYDLPDLTLIAAERLGAASWSETEDRSYLCYPFVPFGYDDAVYVFGRMNAPRGFGNPTHIIRTLDGGSVFEAIEDGWLFDHCGALVVDISGTMFAIRNQAAKATLYRDNIDNNLVLKVTLPFDAAVAPHGMLVDFVSQDVYPASWGADPVMVVKIAPPHLTYTDLTFNHDNTDGIESIIGL